MNSSLTTHYEGLVRQALAGTRLATREASNASALAKLADGKVESFKWVTLILLGLILATQFYFAYIIHARLDRVEAGLHALTIRMDSLEFRMDRVEAGMGRVEARIDGLEARMGGLEKTVHQLSVWQQKHDDLHRRKEQ